MAEFQINYLQTGSNFVPSGPQNLEETRASRGFSIFSRSLNRFPLIGFKRGSGGKLRKYLFSICSKYHSAHVNHYQQRHYGQFWPPPFF
jgi:hypothetical protein